MFSKANGANNMKSIKEYGENGRQYPDDVLQSGIKRRIVLLDDHVLFRNGLIKSCIRPFFENIHLEEFDDGDIALEFIKNELQLYSNIDLIITDINHPGAKGNNFVEAVRSYEALYNSHCRIPILIISMVESSCFPDLLSNNIIDQYISKATEATFIVNCLRRYL